MKKTVLIDTSSAILLFKSGWMDPLLASYRVGTGPTAFREMTVANYPGARTFTRWQQENRLAIHSPRAPAHRGGSDSHRLDAGERECIALYHEGTTAFIIIDDGPGAAFCRRQSIPYVNALLIPRLVNRAGAMARSEVVAAMRKIYSSGHYARWVLDQALACPSDDLTFFLP